MIILSTAAVLALLWILAAIYGSRVAQWRWDHHYRRAELRSHARAEALADLAESRRRELREAEYDQRHRHDDRRRELYNWSRQFNNLLTETAPTKEKTRK